jgi:twitching motility protein PilT
MADTRRVDPILDELVKRGGTDLHLAVNQPPIGRVRGELLPLLDATITGRELEQMLLELVTPAQRGRLATDLDLEFAVELKNVARFRASYYVKQSGIAATFRMVPARPPALAELGCPEVFWRLADRRGGLILVGGPSGNGKTTTAAALLDHINKTRACHVVTLENPIEFVHESQRAQVTQREVGTHVPTFTDALRSVARESPDVVFVSDPSDPTDIERAIRLACDGLLVVVTRASTSVAGTLEGIVRGFDGSAHPRIRGLLADGLAAVVVQHLVRSPDLTSRVAVHEILVNTPRASTLVKDGKNTELAHLMTSSAEEGMQTLDAALERLVGVSKITPEAALERAIDKESFAAMLGRLRPDLATA